MEITKFAIPEIIFGNNGLEYLASCARRHGAQKVFFVSDSGLERSGWVQRACDILERDRLPWTYFNMVESNPRDYQIEKGAAQYVQEGADVIIALGGGSPLDTAKGIALLASNGGRVRDYEGANRIEHPLPPMIFLPSTAGSGSDISQFAIITDVERQVKMAIISRTLVPNISIIDPVILQTKPPELIITSAIDALAHAIESYVSPIASPFSETQSLQSIKLIVTNLQHAQASGDPEALKQLSIASTAAGMAFSNAGLGIDHALAHSLGGVFDVMHGIVHPILLPPIMRFNLPSCPEKMHRIGATVLGRRHTDSNELALAGIEWLEDFFQSFQIPTRLGEILPSGTDLMPICHMATLDACMLSNPRPASPDDLFTLCQEVW